MEDVIVIPTDRVKFEKGTEEYILEDEESKNRVTYMSSVISQYEIDVE